MGFGSRRIRRGVIAGEPGQAIIGPPPYRRYPDRITINDKVFQSADTQQLDYRDAEGNLLDL